MQVQLHRADELVALATCVLPHRSDQLTFQGIAEFVESFEVLRGEEDVELVGHDEPVNADSAPKIHLAREPPAKLDWLELAAERLRKGTFDQTLEAALELLQSHGALRLLAG